MPNRPRKRPRYTVTVEPDHGYLVLRVQELPELITQARFAGEIDHMARDLIAITQHVPPDSFDVLLNLGAHMSTNDKSRDALYDRLIDLGVPLELASAVHADLGDLTEGLARIEELYVQVADGRDVARALEMIESEARDHLSWHVKSLRKTANKLRRLTRKSKRRGADQRPFASSK